jgi:hypothetical protein
MRWKVKKEPELGDSKIKVKFAWLPTIAENTDENNKEYWIWLCLYHAKLVYEKWTMFNVTGSQTVNLGRGWRTKEKTIYNSIKK